MITIVSGLPRSGTSLLMQMLKAGGYPIFYNREPNFDEFNPRGYYEWSEARTLHEGNDERLSTVDGHAVKIFPQSFGALSHHFDYRIIYVDRPVRDVTRSQIAMCQKLGYKFSPTLEDDLWYVRWHAMKYLCALPSVLVPFSQLATDPLTVAMSIQDFLDNRRDFYLARYMASCVDPSLIHWR